MSKKAMPSLLYLHDMFAEVWESRDKSKDPEQIEERRRLREEEKENKTENKVENKKLNKENKKDNKENLEEEKEFIDEEEEMGPGPLLHHIEDFTHPENIFNQCRNFPSQSNSRAHQFMAEKMLSDGREQEAAKLFLLSQAVTFQHLVILQDSKKATAKTLGILAELDQIKRGDEQGEVKEDEAEEEPGRSLRFSSFENSDVPALLGDLPETWSVLQVGVSHRDPVITRFPSTKKGTVALEGNPSLVLVRAQAGQVSVTRCPALVSGGCRPVLAELQEILTENTHVNRNEKNRTKYWSIRKDLDNRLAALLKTVEERWLGWRRSLFLGRLQDPAARARLESVLGEHGPRDLTDDQKHRLRTLLSATPFLTTAELKAGVAEVLPCGPCPNLVMAARTELADLGQAAREPVILVLDPHVQGLPWETLPALTTCRQPVSRVPSLPFLHALWQSHRTDEASVVTAGVANDNVFYVVNPEGNLPDTQQRLDRAFRDISHWEGVAGEQPGKGQLEQVLQSKDAYIFCGHGSGSKMLSGDEVEKLRVHAVPLLLGCGSGQLARHGRSLDPLGTAHSYMMAASPAMVGFLWAVTDADVDQWTVSFLDHWLGGKPGGQPELLQASADRRGGFKQLLNGAAMVVYGLPLKSKK